jgi:hypothetical protein
MLVPFRGENTLSTYGFEALPKTTNSREEVYKSKFPSNRIIILAKQVEEEPR